MRIKDDETTAERIYRQNIVMNHTKKSTPIIASILITCIILVFFIYTYTLHIRTEEYGLGDPYHCSECKELGMACKEHRGYDAKQSLQDKISLVCMNFIPDKGIEYMQKSLYNGSLYNTECDFCTSEQKECYGCSYDREYLTQVATEISKDEVFKSKLCDKCWDLGYANCSYCRAMLEDAVKQKFN